MKCQRVGYQLLIVVYQLRLIVVTPRQNALRMSTTLSFRLMRVSGCVLKSNVNRKKSRTAKFENKKSKLACEGRRKISLVAKFILCLIFKRLHPRVSCLHLQRKMREFRARWRSARANFFHSVLLVALVLLCDSVAVKCEKANKTSRKCAGKIYFLSKELARAAELQESCAICRVHWDEIRRSNNRCSVPRENHPRGLRKQRIPARLFAVLDAIGAICHGMSCQNGLWNFYYLVLSISIFTVYSLRKKWF